MRVTLIDPGYSQDGFNLWGKTYWTTTVHHGLQSISGYLKDRGHTVNLIDIRRLNSWDHFDETYRKQDPQVIGITFRSADYNMIKKIVARVRNMTPNIKIVVGGAHPTADAESAMEIEGIDHAVIGEGEISFAEIVENPDKPHPRIITGIHPDLNQLPYEDRELYDLDESRKHVNYPGHLRPPFITMITCRGCAFQCKYCAPHAENTFGKKMRYQSVERVIEEIQIIDRKCPFKTIKFYNSDFPANRKWVFDLCDALDKANIRKDIMIQSRATSLAKDPELIKRLKSVGLRLVLFGFESGSQRILDMIKKGGTVEHNLAAAELCKKNGVVFGGSYMLGFPGETKEDVLATVAHAKQINANFNSVAFLTPLPGTYFYYLCKEQGISLIEKWEDYYSFTPDQPKVKGVDYEFARKAADEILTFQLGPVMRYIGRPIYVKTKEMVVLRDMLVRMYAMYTTNPLVRWMKGN